MRTARDRGTSVPQYPLVCVTPVQPLNQRGIHFRAKFGGGCFRWAWPLGRLVWEQVALDRALFSARLR